MTLSPTKATFNGLRRPFETRPSFTRLLLGARVPTLGQSGHSLGPNCVAALGTQPAGHIRTIVCRKANAGPHVEPAAEGPVEAGGDIVGLAFEALGDKNVGCGTTDHAQPIDPLANPARLDVLSVLEAALGEDHIVAVDTRPDLVCLCSSGRYQAGKSQKQTCLGGHHRSFKIRISEPSASLRVSRARARPAAVLTPYACITISCSLHPRLAANSALALAMIRSPQASRSRPLGAIAARP